MALRAEYGDDSPGGSSFSGSSCSEDIRAWRSQGASDARSRISPMPQPARERSEKSGTAMPARRC